MNLYLISQDVNNDYDTFDAAIVAAETEDQARLIHPNGKISAFNTFWDHKLQAWMRNNGKNIYEYRLNTWCHIKDVTVEYIGIAKEETARGVILASFNAG